MAASYLTLVNQVLTRLRESAVTTVAQTPYSLLIGAFVNDAKREIEDAWQWSTLLDSLSFSTVAGTYSYETNAMTSQNQASDRVRLWIDDITSKPLMMNTTLNFESLLSYEPSLTDQLAKTNIINRVQKDIPSSYQILQSTANVDGKWNKLINLYAIPNGVYTLKLYIVNPQIDLVLDVDVIRIPTAPVVQKAYLFALYERGEELGESLTLTAGKVEDTISNAITLDQQFSQQYLALTVPYGAQY